MTILNSISTGVQTQVYLPSNSYKNSSPLNNTSFNFRNNNSQNPLISIKKTHKFFTNVSAASDSAVYTQLTEETLYDLLGISQNGSLCDIKRGYKQMALKYHPDMSPPGQVDEYTMRFIQVQEAYETLSDPEARAVYDCNLAKGLHLAFSGKKGSRFEAETGWWKQSWEVQVEELKRRSTVEKDGGKMSWAARIRKQRVESDLDK